MHQRLMRQRLIPVTVGALALGCASAWLTRAVSQSVLSPDAADLATAQGNRHAARAHGSRDMHGSAAAVTIDHEAIATGLADLSGAEMRRLLLNLKSRAGLLAIWDQKDAKLFFAALDHWYAKDPEAAIQWVMGWPNEDDRGYLFVRFLEAEGNKGLDGAVALLGRIAALTGTKLVPTSSMVRKSLLTDADTFLKMIGMGASCPLGEVSFAPDFDFRKVLEARKETGDMPALIAGWTRRDSQAVLDWLRASEVPPSYWQEFAAGYKTVGGQEELGQLAADMLRSGPGGYDQARALLAGGGKMAAVRSFLSNAGGDAAPLAAGLLGESLSPRGIQDPSSGFEPATRDLLLGMIPTEERLALLAKLLGVGKEDGTTPQAPADPQRANLRKSYAESLRKLGHSEAEIETALGPADTYR